MNTLRSELAFESLAAAFRTAFTFTFENDRKCKGTLPDFAGDWADLLASALNDARLAANPAIDDTSPAFPFADPHRILAERFIVARSGMTGGPTIDVLLQLWFDTEELLCGTGIPLVFQRIEKAGRMPDLMWSDLRDICRRITMATPCGRMLFVAKGAGFDWWGDGSLFFSPNPILAVDMHGFAGTRLPPAPLNGRRLDAFCRDLASGWIGDPALSGREASPLLDALMRDFQINHVLRETIARDSREGIWRPEPLPF